MFTSKFNRFATLAESLSRQSVSHSEVVSSVWAHIRAKQLQCPADRRLVEPDLELSKIVGSGVISFGKISSEISRFMVRRSAPKEAEEAAKMGVVFFPHL